MFYFYHQNNSGGIYTGPAADIYIEADTAEQANETAETVGLYWGGGDCECCGPRWDRADERDGEATLEDHRPSLANDMIVYADGRKEFYLDTNDSTEAETTKDLTSDAYFVKYINRLLDAE